MGKTSGVAGTLDVTVVDATIAVDGDLLIADGADTTQGAKADAAETDFSTGASVIALLKGILKRHSYGYETVAAGQTAQVLGGTGAAGDYLAGLLVIPAVVACGLVTLLDGATSIPVFVGGGTTALVDAKPFFIPIGARCASAWKVTTGANVSVIGVGNFT